jgi:hypothetical protein
MSARSDDREFPRPGSRLGLEYFDHNEVFATQLPRDATILRSITSTGGVDDWYLISLDQPVEWDGKAYGHMLIRSRDHGFPLGGAKDVSVFMLLVADPGTLGPDPVDIHRFYLVAWGMARARRDPTPAD